MNPDSLLVDLAAAVVIAAALVVLVSGVATVALIAALVLAACGITLLVDRLRSRRVAVRRVRRRLP